MFYLSARNCEKGTEMSNAAIIETIRETGYTWLTGTDAYKAKALEIRREAKAAGLRIKYSSGKTLHGTKVITLELAD
jgi:hypothetical protein